MRVSHPERAGNRPSSVLLAEKLEPRVMGGLLALYEAKSALQGFIWNINSFDQEGVQLGKVLAARFLEHMSTLRHGVPKDMDNHPESWAMLEAAGVLQEEQTA